MRPFTPMECCHGFTIVPQNNELEHYDKPSLPVRLPVFDILLMLSDCVKHRQCHPGFHGPHCPQIAVSFLFLQFSVQMSAQVVQHRLLLFLGCNSKGIASNSRE